MPSITPRQTAALLLCDVGEFVGYQRVANHCAGLIFAGAKSNLAAHREGARVHRIGGFRGAVVGMNLYA